MVLVDEEVVELCQVDVAEVDRVVDLEEVEVFGDGLRWGC